LHALCSRVLQSTREELRVAYRQWAVEYARQVMCKSDACLRFAIRPRRRPRCPHLYACVSHNCCVGVGSDATLSTARQASMSCPLRPAWTQASGSVPQLLLHLQVDWLIHRTVVTEALSVPPPHRPNSFPLLAALSHAHSTRLQSTQQTARSAPWTTACVPRAQRWQAPLASEGRRYTALRSRAFHPPARPAGSARR
jgi:hypothetical protein